MTSMYFVRHAQPEHDWKEDRTRPLTEEGKKVHCGVNCGMVLLQR